jgi:protein phosphatase
MAAALTRQTVAASEGDETEDDAESEEDAQPKRKRHKGMMLVLIILVLGLVGGGGYAAYAWSQDQYFVGTQAGNVAIYRGLPQDVGPVHLSSLYERQSLPVEELPSYWRDQVQQRITAPDLPKARAVVENLRQQAALCATSTPTATATPSTTPTTSQTSASATATGTKVTSSPTTSTVSPTTTATAPADNGCGAG